MPCLLTICPDTTDGTSFYRGIGPLATLARKTGEFTIRQVEIINWTEFKYADAVFLQRPFHRTHLQIAQMAKMHRRPLWVDYDDNLFEVPRGNPFGKNYQAPDVHANIVEILRIADFVTVTTPALGRVLAPFAKTVIVVPNAYDDDVLGPVPMDFLPREKLVVWRGSQSHNGDLMHYAKDICDGFAALPPDWHFEFFGEPFWGIVEQMRQMLGPAVFNERVTVTPPTHPVNYMLQLRLKRPAVVIVPLEDVPFNRAKSNVAWIEATQAGAVTVAPGWWEEWNVPGVLPYGGEFSLKWAIETAIHETLPATAPNFLADLRTLSIVNDLRRAVLQRLF